MIRVAVLYPNAEGSSFDVDYYINHHMKLVQEKMGPLGLLGWEVDAGIAGMDNSTAPFACIGYISFESVQAFEDAFGKVGEELVADIPNYTNITPTIQIGEHTKG
jgi:uncharacterized protein (TIGR02118 family)